MNELSWIQHWYQKQSDGKWEHQYGVEIGTLDNPGWRVEIDGLTADSISSLPRQHAEEDSETSWVKCSLSDGKFQGHGGPQSLEKIINIFRTWIDPESL